MHNDKIFRFSYQKVWFHSKVSFIIMIYDNLESNIHDHAGVKLRVLKEK